MSCAARVLPLSVIVVACTGRSVPGANAGVPGAPPTATSSDALLGSSAEPRGSVAEAPLAEPDAGTAASSGRVERRCGWVENPTPANWWLVDRDGEWEIGVQGGYQAEGEMPDFGGRWVETNVHYGHGCACMNVRVEKATKRVLDYGQVQVLPIETCQRDPKLPRR